MKDDLWQDAKKSFFFIELAMQARTEAKKDEHTSTICSLLSLWRGVGDQLAWMDFKGKKRKEDGGLIQYIYCCKMYYCKIIKWIRKKST